MLLVQNQSLLKNQRLGRRAWVWPRPQNWCRVLLGSRALDILWKEHFHVSRPTFDYICNLVSPDLQKQHTRMRAPVSVEERVGLAFLAYHYWQFLQELWLAIWLWQIDR